MRFRGAEIFYQKTESNDLESAMGSEKSVHPSTAQNAAR